MNTPDDVSRAEARRRWPNGLLDTDNARDFLVVRHGFALGAEWQRSRPFEVTDAMVEAAAKSWSRAPFPSRTSINRARAALDAAFTSMELEQ